MTCLPVPQPCYLPPFPTLRRTHTSLISAVCIYISKCNLFSLFSYLNVCFQG